MDPSQVAITLGAIVATLLLVVVVARQSPPEQLTAQPQAAPPLALTTGLADRFRQVLARTRESLRGGISGLLGGATIDEAAIEDLELALLTADVGMPTTQALLEPIRKQLKAGNTDGAVLRASLRDDLRAVLTRVHAPLASQPAEGPLVILVVGVNGSGKTTTIGKLAARFQAEGKRVVLGAGDTYRAAAAEQLGIWAERSGADIIAHQEGGDPGAVVFDTLAHAKARGHDVVILDTAGRLQTKKPLMDQLSKVRRVIDRQVAGAPHETLLVVDGTIGQNALSQAHLFNEATPITGVVVTKLDGTAKGGMVFAVANELQLPVKLVGVGEKIEDLRDFDVDAFVDALL